MSVLAALLLVAVAAVTGSTDSSPESNRSGNESQDLISDLRRRLMDDNSDYSAERAVGDALRMRAEHAQRGPPPRHSAEGDADTTSPEQAVADTDLLYYLDDDKLKPRTPDNNRYTTLEVRRSARSRYVAEGGAPAPAPASAAALSLEVELPPPPADDVDP